MQSGSENMLLRGEGELASAAGFALTDRPIGWFKGWRRRTKPEYVRKQTGCKNMSEQDRRESESGASGELESQARSEMSGGTKQTKPEYSTKKGAYKNISRALGWLSAAVSSRLRRGSNGPAVSGRRLCR